MIVFLPAFLSLYMMDTFGHNTVCVLSLSFGANRHFNVRVFTFSRHNSVIVLMTIIFVYVYVVLPIAGRLLTDGLLSLLL